MKRIIKINFYLEAHGKTIKHFGGLSPTALYDIEVLSKKPRRLLCPRRAVVRRTVDRVTGDHDQVAVT